jgi:putative PIN family toxin of toxin-antitoxin system
VVRVAEPAGVVDTNLFVSAVISPNGSPARLLEAWRQGWFRLLIADAQLDEIARVLSRSWLRDRYGVTHVQVAGLLRELEGRAHRIVPLPYEKLPLRCRDTDDDALLASALGGGADYLVTGDEDLLVLDGDPRLGQLRIVRVGDFLTRLPDA